MTALILELARVVLFLSTSHIMFRLKMISLMVFLAPHGEVAKDLLVTRLATVKLFVSVDAIVGLEILATTNAYKLMANVLPNIVMFVIGKNLKDLSET